MEKLTVRNVGKTHEMIEKMNKEINELNKKYEIMKENAETLAARIDKAIEYCEKSNITLKSHYFIDVMNILKGVI